MIVPAAGGDVVPVEFLHELGQHPRSWQGVLDALPGWVDGHASTLPGVTAPARHEDLLDDAADWALAELAERSEEPGVLVGHGYGARVAMRAARREPGLVRAVVLSSPFLRAPRAWRRGQRELSRWLPSDSEAEGRGEFTRERLDRILSALHDADASADLSSLTQPVLVLAPAQDRGEKRAAARVAKSVPHGRLSVLPRVGLESNRTEPALFADLLVDWLAERRER